ncbi:hypothetical protein AR457_02250 [Streptomyces agglomeratus]|uniref:hypothetical protein n=1 Tax=Streptomyces agglomeratus TaxID=285458 RepID=UPI000853F3A8|nr:hypothetical protein [Streptomyces agglomeratus]OEJ43097.1 hypothetical protein AR457_02250 [Streptomyces agglomeratus]OEJ62354.1 hypothetical protein BGM19_34455 [Streptomyces agglomeratus]
MNAWFLAAGITAAVVAAIHAVAGGRDVVRPLLAADLADEPRRVLHAVWHMVTADLTLAAAALMWLAWGNRPGGGTIAWLLVAHFVAYSGVFLVVSLAASWSKPLVRLPQWMLLLPVAVLAGIGAA